MAKKKNNKSNKKQNKTKEVSDKSKVEEVSKQENIKNEELENKESDKQKTNEEKSPVVLNEQEKMIKEANEKIKDMAKQKEKKQNKQQKAEGILDAIDELPDDDVDKDEETKKDVSSKKDLASNNKKKKSKETNADNDIKAKEEAKSKDEKEEKLSDSENSKNKADLKKEKLAEKEAKLKEKQLAKEKKKQEKVANKESDAQTNKTAEKSNDTPNYIEDPNKKHKTLKAFLIIVISLMVCAMILSTVFALININNTNILSKIVVHNVDISNLSVEEARSKLENQINSELQKSIGLVYQDVNISILPEEIEFKYDLNSAIDTAYNYGRTGNLLENNYSILESMLFSKDIELQYTYDETLLTQFVDNVSSNLPGLVQNPSYEIEGANLKIDPGKAGIVVLKQELAKQIVDTILNGSNTEEIVQIIDIPVQNVDADPINIDQIYSEIKQEPKDAYYVTEPDFKIFKEENGVDLAISVDEAKAFVANPENLSQVEIPVETETEETETEGENEELQPQVEVQKYYNIPLTITPPAKTINSIGLEAFPYLIATFTTRFDSTNINRSKNLSIATDKIDGTVLMPGETFSYNQVVGKRTIDEGYRNAKIYENGQVVDGLAGGICQVSSTLYNAALLANLEVTERHNHSFTTSYLPAGRDATVVYGVKDLQFTNTRNYPVKIEGIIESGILKFNIHGIKEENEYDIKIIPTTTSTIPNKTTTTVDKSLAPGQRVTVQSGHIGYRVTTRMQKYLNGELVYNEIISNDVYNPMETIVRVGP